MQLTNKRITSSLFTALIYTLLPINYISIKLRLYNTTKNTRDIVYCRPMFKRRHVARNAIVSVLLITSEIQEYNIKFVPHFDGFVSRIP